MEEWYIFCLECEGGYWFLGHCRAKKYPTVVRRHREGKASEFTRQHRPVAWKILEQLPAYTNVSLVDKRLHDYVKLCVERQGYDKVHSKNRVKRK